MFSQVLEGVDWGLLRHLCAMHCGLCLLSGVSQGYALFGVVGHPSEEYSARCCDCCTLR